MNNIIHKKKGFTKHEIDKLGNTIIYLTEKIPGITKTQCLKLLYLLDEVSIKKFGIPFLGLKYEIWQFGPVSQEVFVELSDSPEVLSDYISTETDSNSFSSPSIRVKAKREFCDDEFTDNDISILDYVMKSYGNLNAGELIDVTHQPNSLWHIIAKENGILELFERKLKRTSNCQIDFSRMLDNDKKSIYTDYLRNQKVLRSYNV